MQLFPEARRKGLGKFLMQILELIAYQAKMKKVVLTVFKGNSASGYEWVWLVYEWVWILLDRMWY